MKKLLLVVLMLVLATPCFAGERRCKGIYREEPIEQDHTFVSGYLGYDQNLIQITPNWYLNGQARWFPQQYGQSDYALVGLVITNSKALLNLSK